MEFQLILLGTSTVQQGSSVRMLKRIQQPLLRVSRQTSSIFFCARMLPSLRAPSIHDGLSRNRAVTKRERRALPCVRSRERSRQEIPVGADEP